MARAIEDRRERRAAVEHARDRLALVRDAGWGKISGFSVAAGVLAAYGAFAIVAGIVAAVLHAIGIDSEKISDNDWHNLGTGAAVVVAVVFLAAYLFGGYVAGRMARRAGVLHGFLVFVFGVLVLVAVAAIAHAQDGTDALLDRLDSLGIPTSGDEWAEIGSVAGIAALLAMLVGSLLGGSRGERWHQRLAARALDPGIGPEADLDKSQRRLERKRRRAERNGVLTPSRTDTDGGDDTNVGERRRRRSFLDRFRRRRRARPYEQEQGSTGRDIDLSGDERAADETQPGTGVTSVERDRQDARNQ
jgi:spore maturation protein SpmB